MINATTPQRDWQQPRLFVVSPIAVLFLVDVALSAFSRARTSIGQVTTVLVTVPCICKKRLPVSRVVTDREDVRTNAHQPTAVRSYGGQIFKSKRMRL